MRKLLCVLLALLLLAAVLLTGCGAAPASTVPDPVSSVAEPEPEPEPPYIFNPLTGEENDGSYVEGTRLTAVMFNNIAGSASQNARPQWGISEAKVLIEIKVEGGITRLCGLFDNYENLPQIGPIRSARDQYFQMVMPWQPLFVHIGESVVQTEYRNNYDYNDRDINLDKYGFPRDEKRRATGVAVEHTAYSNGELLTKVIEKNNFNTDYTYKQPIFNFVNYNEPNRELNGDACQKVDVIHSNSYRTYFSYDSVTNKYMMSQYSAAKGAIHETVDANNNEQLGFENLIVIFADIHVYPGHEAKDLQKVEYTTSYKGVYINGGKVEPIIWSKSNPYEILNLTYENNEPLQLNPGKTYLAVVDFDEAKNFTYYATPDGQSAEVDPNASSTAVVDE